MCPIIMAFFMTIYCLFSADISTKIHTFIAWIGLLCISVCNTFLGLSG